MFESYGWKLDLGSAIPGWDRTSKQIAHPELAPPNPTPPPIPGIVAGSFPVGNSNYSIVLGSTYFVSKTGSDTTGNGSDTKPYATVQKAITAVPSNSIICIRAGIYHEELTTPGGKVVTIQAAPHEAVWFDGTSVYSSWTVSGSVWTTSYAVKYDRTLGGSVANYPGNATRSLVDQVWIDNVPLTQIADNTTPAAGQFSVNQTAKTLTIGNNPSGKTVRVADLDVWLVSSGVSNFYGIGVRRYSPQMIEFLNALAYFGGSMGGSIMENCVFQESAMAGLAFATKNLVARSLTIQDCGYTGVMFTTSDNLMIEKCLIRRLNRGAWTLQPATGGVKGTRSDLITMRDNFLTDIPGAPALWLDVSCIRFSITNNEVQGAGTSIMNSGLMIEESDGGTLSGITYKSYLAGNRVRSCMVGAYILCSGNMVVANNDLRGNDIGVYLQQDRPQNGGTSSANRPTSVCPWLINHMEFYNNMFDCSTAPVKAYQIQFMCYDDGPKTLRGWDPIDKMAGNQFATSGTMASLGVLGGARTSFNTLSALASSGSTVGGPPGAKLGTNYQGASAPSSIATAVTSALSAMLYVAVGTQLVGPNAAKIPTKQEP